MKTLRKLFYGSSLCIFLICVGILIFTSNPEWSKKLSEALYGEDKQSVEVTPAPMEETQQEDVSGPKNTPMVYGTPTPEYAGSGQESNQDQPKEEEYVPKSIDIKAVIPPKAQITAYQVPMSDANEIPEKLSGLNGFVEITVKQTELKPDEVAALENELDFGDTGDLLEFDEEFYPYYHMLDDTQKDLYRQIYANAYAMKARFKPCVDVFSVELGQVIEAVYNDNPVLFWLDNAYACKFKGDGKVVEIELQFNETANKPEQSIYQFENSAEEILRVARTMASDYDKEKYVHDALAARIIYEADAPMNQSAYSALVNGRTVCAGYARAFQYLMQQLGVPCYYCRGYSGENHAWNIVEIHGEYYNVDLTWDDSEVSNYAYFNKTDDDFKDTHTRKGMSVKLPACNGTLYRQEDKEMDNNQTVSNTAGVELYYDKMCKRIESAGIGDESYTDLMDADVWKQLETAYINGNSDFREKYLVKALHKAGAQYCIISLSAEEVTPKAFQVECSIKVR